MLRKNAVSSPAFGAWRVWSVYFPAVDMMLEPLSDAIASSLLHGARYHRLPQACDTLFGQRPHPAVRCSIRPERTREEISWSHDHNNRVHHPDSEIPHLVKPRPVVPPHSSLPTSRFPDTSFRRKGIRRGMTRRRSLPHRGPTTITAHWISHLPVSAVAVS